jgi:chlorobactene glucosyltransferase
MFVLLSGVTWACLVVYLLLRIMRQRGAHRAARLLPIEKAQRPAAVAVIVPVRNEVANIAACLCCLTRQRGLAPGSSITIVDDGSDDGTAAAIGQRVGDGLPVHVLTAGSLPEGWIGKPHACWVGALTAADDWLCFVDADVRIDARLVATAVEGAQARQIDMLSLHPFQQLGSFWERLVIPAGLMLIACAKPFGRIPATASPAADANGQFILIRREVYFAVGGHAAIAGEISEDQALASRVIRAGFRFRALAAEELASTRMYRDLGSLWQGLTKNAIDILGSGFRTVCVALVGVLVGWVVPLAPVTLAIGMPRSATAADWIGLGLLWSASIVVLGVHLLAARHFRIPAAYGLLMPLGYTLALLIVCQSLLMRMHGRVLWKQRRYDLRRGQSEAPP